MINSKDIHSVDMDILFKIPDDLISDYLVAKNISLNNSEIDDLKVCFCKQLDYDNKSSNSTRGWYLSETIQQISVEFDAIKYSQSKILNIELKKITNSSTRGKAKNTLISHEMYLTSLKPFFSHDVEIIVYAYFVDSNKFFKLEADDIVEISNDEKQNLIDFVNAEITPPQMKISDIDPNKFIINPLSNAEKFLKGEYFLTGQQMDVSNEICSGNSIGVYGLAGTGKSMVLYDSAKKLKDKGKNVLVIFCVGSLGTEHTTFSAKTGITIVDCNHMKIKNILDKNSFDIILVDESQRMYYNTIDLVLEWYKKNQKNQICFFFDDEQFFSSMEIGKNIRPKIEHFGINVDTLTKKIRSSMEINYFIDSLVDKGVFHEFDYRNIKFEYFNDYENANGWLNYLSEKENYKTLVPMKDFYNITNFDAILKDSYGKDRLNSHQMIGSEVDKASVIIDQNYSYGDKGKLMSSLISGYPYYLGGQLVVNLTRAKEKLALAVVNNPDIFRRINQIIKNNH